MSRHKAKLIYLEKLKWLIIWNVWNIIPRAQKELSAYGELMVHRSTMFRPHKTAPFSACKRWPSSSAKRLTVWTGCLIDNHWLLPCNPDNLGFGATCWLPDIHCNWNGCKRLSYAENAGSEMTWQRNKLPIVKAAGQQMLKYSDYAGDSSYWAIYTERIIVVHR